jgi:hypothetical protein
LDDLNLSGGDKTAQGILDSVDALEAGFLPELLVADES